MVGPGKAEVVGGGFGGLVAAIGLADRGWRVTLHERSHVLRSEGYGISIQPNMTRLFAALGVLDEVLAGGAKIDRRDSLDGRGRVVLSQTATRSPYRINRHHIVSLLGERARRAGVEIMLGSTIAGVTPDGVVTPEDGDRRRADLVVVADGVNSALRDSLGLLSRRIWQKDGGVRVTIPRLPEEIAATERDGTPLIEAWSDKRRVLYCPVNRDEFYVLLTCLATDQAARAVPIDPAVWAASFPAMRGLFERVAEQADWANCRWAQFQTVHLRRWSKGCIAVLGDAAHAMPPYLGQGAGFAMMNALGLAVALAEASDLEAAFDLWERRERPLTEHTQRWTRIYGTTIFMPETLKQIAIRAEQAIPWLAAQYARAANHRPTGCTDRG